MSNATSPIPKTTIDPAAGTVTVHEADGNRVLSMASDEGFMAASRAWLRCSWDAKYVYSFSWMGRPVIQLPEDMLRLQEVIFATKPDLLIETGIAHGGSLIFYASLFTAMGRGRVLGIDIEIRPHNRTAIEAHPMFGLIDMIEGSSVAADTISAAREHIRPDDGTVMVVLDANHTKDHVLAELEAYGPMVTPGSWIVACDGIMSEVAGGPRTGDDWAWNNPTEAAREFCAAHPDFVLEEPAFPFNEGAVTHRVTYWPGAFIRRIR